MVAILPVLACFALLSAQAIAPPPDGCSANFNTAEGCNALQLIGAGAGNTGLGWRALFSTGAGSLNTATGAGALVLNTIGVNNTATGAVAGLLNGDGVNNTANGAGALEFNVHGSNNTAIGALAMINTANAAGGGANTAVGSNAMNSNVTGAGNTAVGGGAMVNGDGATVNTAVGIFAGNGITGTSNVVLGGTAGTGVTSGGHNVCVGFGAGSNIATASGNVYLGDNVNPPGPGLEFNTIRIRDSSAQVAGTNSTTFIGGIWMATIGAANAVVGVNANGQLGTAASSARFKKDIEPMDQSSEVIFSLKPVSFHYRGDETNLPCFGLIAEEVAKVDPNLILLDKEGNPWTVRYEQINAMLLNEFLKEHKKVEAQQASISELKSEMQTMVAQLKEQASQIQKVSAQVEMSKPAPQVVVNKP